jgi:hypothetical protein
MTVGSRTRRSPRCAARSRITLECDPRTLLEVGPGTAKAHPLGWALTRCFDGGGGRI